MTPILLSVALSLPIQVAPLARSAVQSAVRWQEPAKQEPAKKGDVARSLTVDGEKRSYHFHLPKGYDPNKPTPVVLVLHGAGTNGKIMEFFCGMTSQADKSGFICVYPNGTGTGDVLLTWNAGMFPGPLAVKKPNDVVFLGKVLDDLTNLANVDPKRIYVTGMSNGGMMAYRVATEMSDRIAAMAAIGGVSVVEKWQPKHPMPVLHIHGTEDGLVPFEGAKKAAPAFVRFRPVEDNVKMCAKANGCNADPKITELPQSKDAVRILKHDYGKGANGAEVVLYVLDGAGHTWPGRSAPAILGRTTHNLIANEVIWDFFRRYTRE